MPKCGCHGEPMLWNKDHRCRAGGFWRCAVKGREARREWFANLSGLNYSKRQLDNRRANALLRRRQRKDVSG